MNSQRHIQLRVHLLAMSRLAQRALDYSIKGYVLRHQEALRFRELTSSALHPHIDRWAGAQGDFERSVIRSLGQVAKQAHEIAEAILFWLEGKLNVEGRPSAAVEGRHISLEFPS